MQIVGCGQVKPVRDLNIGELCVIQGGGQSNLGICIDKQAQGSRIGLIDAAEATGKSYVYENHIHAHALGTDFVIDVSGNPLLMPQHVSGGALPSLLLGQDGLFFYFTDEFRHRYYFFTVGKKEKGQDSPEVAVPFESFRIWLDRPSFEHPGMVPLYTR